MGAAKTSDNIESIETLESLQSKVIGKAESEDDLKKVDVAVKKYYKYLVAWLVISLLVTFVITGVTLWILILRHYYLQHDWEKLESFAMGILTFAIGYIVAELRKNGIEKE